MSAGTIALTANGTAVTGTGTTFTTELKAGDFVVATVGGTAYTLGVLSVTSNTALVLSQAYQGATASGLTWQAVPFATLNLITSALAAQVSYAVRGFNLDKNNWQQIFSGTGNVTVTLPDGTSWTGPAWNGIATTIANKADLVSGAVAITQGGTGAKTAAAAWAALATYGTAAGTAAQGNDTRLNTINGKSGGLVNGEGNFSLRVTAPAIGNIAGLDQAAGTQGGYINWNRTGVSGAMDFLNNRGAGTGGFRFRTVNSDNSQVISDYTMQASGTGTSPGGWTTSSDERIKTGIKDIDPEYALEAVISMRHVTYKMRDRYIGSDGWLPGASSCGYLAQELEKWLPEAVTTGDEPEFPYKCRGDNDEVLSFSDVKAIDAGKAAATLNGAAIKALYARTQNQDKIIAELQERLKALDGLDS